LICFESNIINLAIVIAGLLVCRRCWEAFLNAVAAPISTTWMGSRARLSAGQCRFDRRPGDLANADQSGAACRIDGVARADAIRLGANSARLKDRPVSKQSRWLIDSEAAVFQ